MKKKKFYSIIIGISLSIIILALLMPIVINSFYLTGLKNKIPGNTMFSANDLLLYIGSVLALIGTIALGIIAVIQNNRLHEINTQLEKENSRIQLLMAQESVPFISLNSFSLDSTKPIEYDLLHLNSINLNVYDDGHIEYLIRINRLSGEDDVYTSSTFGFYLKNDSQARISNIEVKSITLEKRISEKSSVLKTQLIDVYKLEQGLNRINSLFLPNREIPCKLIVNFGSYYDEIFATERYLIKIELKISIITGGNYYETIELHSIKNKLLPTIYTTNTETISE